MLKCWFAANGICYWFSRKIYIMSFDWVKNLAVTDLHDVIGSRIKKKKTDTDDFSDIFCLPYDLLVRAIKSQTLGPQHSQMQRGHVWIERIWKGVGDVYGWNVRCRDASTLWCTPFNNSTHQKKNFDRQIRLLTVPEAANHVSALPPMTTISRRCVRGIVLRHLCHLWQLLTTCDISFGFFPHLPLQYYPG